MYMYLHNLVEMICLFMPKMARQVGIITNSEDFEHLYKKDPNNNIDSIKIIIKIVLLLQDLQMWEKVLFYLPRAKKMAMELKCDHVQTEEE